MKRKNGSAIAAVMALLVLILDGKTAFSGAEQGLELCLSSAIPALFPFILLSNCLLRSLSGTVPGLSILGKAFRIPKGSESILLLGFLGGYPTGAQLTAQGYLDGQLSKTAAQRMLMFSSQAGPAFLFGLVAAQFTDRSTVWILWLIQLLSAWIVSLTVPGQNDAVRLSPRKNKIPVLRQALGIMAQICGWIVLFRILLSFLERWILWLLPVEGQVLITGLLELTNGCSALSRIETQGMRLVLSAVILSFGGICVTMQTSGLMGGLGISGYLRGKLLQACISAVLAGIIQFFLFSTPDRAQIPLPTWILAGFLWILFRIPIKRGGKIPAGVV